jgi:hypothetical protein
VSALHNGLATGASAAIVNLFGPDHDKALEDAIGIDSFNACIGLTLIGGGIWWATTGSPFARGVTLAFPVLLGGGLALYIGAAAILGGT